MDILADNQREKDIQDLCRQVLAMEPHQYYNPNGADESTCPFCSEGVRFITQDMATIGHKTWCAYNLAKDLSTNLR